MDSTIAPPSRFHLSAAQRTIFDLSNQSTEQGLLTSFREIIASLGVDLYHYTGNFEARGDNEIRKTFSNLPLNRSDFFFFENFLEFDQMSQTPHHRYAPIIFDEPDIKKDSCIDSYRRFKANGTFNGVIFPIHGPNGNHAVVSFLKSHKEYTTNQAIAPSVGDMALIAMCFHDAMIRIIEKSHHILKAPLTEREIECLRLIACRKSNWAIAKIFDISPDGVSYYVRRLMWKLGAHDRHHAVERAAAYGLI